MWGAPEDFFEGLVNLRAIFSLAAGVEHLLNHPGLPANVPIAKLEDAGMGEKMAEYVLYGVLQAQRHMAYYHECQQQEIWAQDAAPVDAKDCHVGILGLGTLGTIAAQRLTLNGYPVHGWSRSEKQVEGVICHHGPDGLQSMLVNLKVLVCLLPLTDATRGILNASLFDQAPKGLFLVNLARGGHLRDNDLLDALSSGQVTGALLDVTEPEPLPDGHAFWKHPRITLTPHIAGPTMEAESVIQIATNIRRFVAGEEISGLVDQNAGY